MLANKLDDDIKISYTAVVTPLFISFITLIIMSFSAKGGNKCVYIKFFILTMYWLFPFTGWFGMRKDFCSFLLGACPLLQEYANISYHSESRSNGVELQHTENNKNEMKNVKKADLLKPVLPIISIEMPDWISWLNFFFLIKIVNCKKK